MLWYKSPHSMAWTPVPIVDWTDKYEELSEFLEEFPELKNLFDFV